jgi:hypothetical protein
VAWIAPFPLLGSGDPDASGHGRGGEAVDAAQGDGGLDPLAIVTARAGAGRSAFLGAASRARRGRGSGRRSPPSRRRARPPRRCGPPPRRLWGHVLASRWRADRGALARRDHRSGRRGRGWRHGRRSCLGATVIENDRSHHIVQEPLGLRRRRAQAQFTPSTLLPGDNATSGRITPLACSPGTIISRFSPDCSQTRTST